MNKNFCITLGSVLVLALTGCSNKTCSVKEAVTPSSSSAVRAGSAEDFAQNVPSKIYFRFNDSHLTESGKSNARSQAAWLKTYQNTSATVAGHCDERGTAEYNMALGARRADATKSALVSEGVSPDRIDTISYGKDRPAAVVDPANPGSAESVHAQNRRTETTIK